MDRDEVIERLCALQSEVHEAIGLQHEADCFCGKGGFWGSGSYGPTHAEGYRNDGAALEFIEAAVRTAIALRSAGGIILEPPDPVPVAVRVVVSDWRVQP